MRKPEQVGLLAVALILVVGLPLGNLLPPSSPLHVSNFTLNLFGKFLTYAILALGLDLLWGYAGVLSLGHGVFFGLGAYAMGMHLMLEIGSKSVYQSALPDFMVWNQVKDLPLFWRPFYSAPFTLVAIVLVPALCALVFGFLAFRSRVRGVYLSIITQALALSAWLVFNRNEMNLGGTNGLADFKTIFGVPLNQPSTQRMLYVVTAITLVAAWALCRWITQSRAGKVLVAIRDSETRVLFSGYSPASYKLFVFVDLGEPGRGGGRALRAPGRDHHPGQDGRAALHRDGGVGGGRRAGDPDRRRAGGHRRQLDPVVADHELPRPVAAVPRRPLHERRALHPRRRRRRARAPGPAPPPETIDRHS